MNDLLTLTEMSRHIGVTQQWLREEAEAGRIPCLKAGRRLLFAPCAVREVLYAKASQKLTGGRDLAK